MQKVAKNSSKTVVKRNPTPKNHTVNRLKVLLRDFGYRYDRPYLTKKLEYGTWSTRFDSILAAAESLVWKEDQEYKDRFYKITKLSSGDIKKNPTTKQRSLKAVYVHGGKITKAPKDSDYKYKAETGGRSRFFNRIVDARNWLAANKYVKKNPVKKANALAPKPKRNATASDFREFTKIKLEDLARRFQGTTNGLNKRVASSDYTPNEKYRLGYLVQMKVKNGGKNIVLDFDGESLLSADFKNNLWVVGKDARLKRSVNGFTKPAKGKTQHVGELFQIDYVTAKKHIENGETVRFFHKLGEVTREHPHLFIDHDGFPLIIGGGYDIWDVGIVN